MKPRFIEFTDKHPKKAKEERTYFNVPDESWLSYGCSYSNDYLKVDIDDYDHKSGELDSPIKDNPRSSAVVALLDAEHIKYNGIQTEHGKHLFFKKPSWMDAKNKQNWYSAIGIKCEWKFPDSDDHIPLKVNGVERTFFAGSLTNESIDELPYFLYPIQKPKLEFPEGDRTQNLGGYLFKLVEKGLSPDEAFKTIRFMNEYVFEKPIRERTLEAEILNDSTYAKLVEERKNISDKNLSHVTVAEEIIERFNIITVNNICYGYEGGIYKKLSDEKIKAYICEKFPSQKDNFRKEVVTYLKGKSYKDAPEGESYVNVKNGILSFDDEGKAAFLPHNQNVISFRQFNAEYNPAANSAKLYKLLNNVFMGDEEQIRLLKQLLGYLLMNHVEYQKIFFFIGVPATGKSTILGLIAAFCGKENVSAVQLEDLNKPHGLAPLVNKTANIFTDLKKTKMLASDMFKMLADGSFITVNPKYAQQFSYRFTGKMLFGMNNKPDFSNDLSGVPRRIIWFSFNHVFDKNSPDYEPHIQAELEADSEAMATLLNMALEGYSDLVKNRGFADTKANDALMAEFIVENDTVLKWLHDAEITEEYLLRMPIKDGYEGSYPEYQSFCLSIGEDYKAQKDFTSEINEKFCFESFRKELRIDGKKQRYQMFRRKKV